MKEARKVRSLIEEKHKEATLIMMARAKFNELDTDSDEMLEHDELRNVVQWVISQYEYEYGQELGSSGYVLVALMEHLDWNKDGALSIAEFEALFKHMLHRNLVVQKALAKFSEF